ncbi:Hsp70 family protein [Aspergillus affinis]|uniref:Hsp70 family protein n=1 Tax=Aspergillus affinis TaxID=1070780 RepID=UPI0022FE6E9F|nr:uncharacterized protein KD926_003716 [Aspergillus affinis]KAI9035355.1 hypothetical protein KD926_003716 [Aspergillus affinis]
MDSSPPTLIIGLDYGTTFSAYPEDNPGLVQNGVRWGHQVAPTMSAASWTKLLLTDEGATVSDEDLQWAIAVGVSHLPGGRSPVQVVADYLHMLYEQLGIFVREDLAKDPEGWGIPLDLIQMQVWLAVPAAWSEIPREDLRRAASRAGFGSRAGDQLSLLTEPEAALMTTLLRGRLENGSELTIEEHPIPFPAFISQAQSEMFGSSQVNMRLYVIAGEEASYIITSQNPLEYRELTPSTGDIIGSTSIVRAFCRFLSNQWQNSFNQAPPGHLIAPGSSVMKWFELLKHGYDGTQGENVYRQRLLDHGLPASISQIELPRHVLHLMTEPVVRRVCALLRTHLKDARDASHQPGLRTKVFLVGGFSQSMYHRREVADVFDRTHLIAVFPLKDPLASSGRNGGCALGPPRFTPGGKNNPVKLWL